MTYSIRIYIWVSINIIIGNISSVCGRIQCTCNTSGMVEIMILVEKTYNNNTCIVVVLVCSPNKQEPTMHSK